jgi:hypothetical protein
MKATKITYWITTSLITLSLAMAGMMYFGNPEVAAGFTHLGFPEYFRKELGIFKIIGALTLILPMIPRNVKEWTYAGIGITFISASIAHAASGDPSSNIITPIVQLLILATSYIMYARLQKVRVTELSARALPKEA